jgi:hypothetical protein
VKACMQDEVDVRKVDQCSTGFSCVGTCNTHFCCTIAAYFCPPCDTFLLLPHVCCISSTIRVTCRTAAHGFLPLASKPPCFQCLPYCVYVCLSTLLVCLCNGLQLYVHHFCGHYMFLPMFFNNALCNWCFPNRWRLPAKALEEVSTSVRVIARLLWTVHLDFSQEVGGPCAWALRRVCCRRNEKPHSSRVGRPAAPHPHRRGCANRRQ